MKLKENVTYLLNLAPGWFVKAHVVEAHPPTDGAGGHYTVSEYVYCDFAQDSFVKALQRSKGGKSTGVEKVNGVNLHPVPDEAHMGISDAMIIQFGELSE